MNIIIAGAGKVGAALAAELSVEDHNVTIIDTDQKVLANAVETMDVMAVAGNGANMKVLREAGIESADLLIAATNLDELNILSCLTARKLGVERTIARVRMPEYFEQLRLMLDELGLSMVVNPELDAAREAYRLLEFPSFLKRETFARGRIEIVGIKIDSGSRLAGASLFRFYEIAKAKAMVCVVEREDGVHIPTGSFVLEEGDTIYVTADMHNLSALVENLGLNQKKIKSVFIIGGSRISYYLAKQCLENGIAVKIIEQNHKRCIALAEALPKATIIEADGSSSDILSSEGLGDYDACVTLTGIDEENLVLSLYAQELGVEKVITKVNRSQYDNLFNKIDVGSVISPKSIASANIVRYVRAMSTANELESVVSLHPIVNGKVEALEFKVDEGDRHRNEPLEHVPIKSGILVACINRSGGYIVPKGDTYFSTGDTVIIVAQVGHQIKAFNDIFTD